MVINTRHVVLWPGSTRKTRNSYHSHAAVKVHPVDTNGRVVFDTQIDVFADPETEVARLREIPFPQLVFLDLQPSLQDLLRLGAPDGDVDGNLLITTDPKRSHGVACFAFALDACQPSSLSDRTASAAGLWKASVGSVNVL